MSIDEVYTLAAKTLAATNEQELRERYGHLNLGMQRLNLSNRLRAATK